MKGNKKYQAHPSNSPKCYENKLPVRRRSKQSGDLIGNKMNAGTRQQQQTAMNFPVNFLDKFFISIKMSFIKFHHMHFKVLAWLDFRRDDKK